MTTKLAHFFNEVWNKANRDAIARFVSPDCVVHDAAGDTTGPEGFYPFFDRMSATLSETHLTIDDEIVCGDKEVVRWSSTARHTGDGLGFPATGRSIAVTGITIVRVGTDGMLIEAWQNWDMYAMLTQLGVFETPAPVYIASRA